MTDRHRTEWADHPALITTDRCLSYGELSELVAEAGSKLRHDQRQLVHLPMTTSVEAIVALLATIESGNVALITTDDPDQAEPIVTRYRPDATWSSNGLTSHREPQHLLHPELAALLSTSGSTGSAKLVRLSATNLVSNADAIARSLGLGPDDRAITSLPLHYSYGLSVLTSHLRVGASLVVSDTSFIESEFWDEIQQHQVTNMAVVPLMAQLIAAHGGVPDDVTSLRFITQAGGKLEPHEATQWAEASRRAGRKFYVMYGQTEATARMTVLPWEELAEHPDTVGRPIADSRIDLAPVDDVADLPKGAGELVFSGPGVMLGYAEHSDDLALGRMIDELHTGDLATIDDDGLVRIVGRRSDFCKIAGLRVDLAAVQARLARDDLAAIVVGDDDGLAVALDGAREPTATTAEIRDAAAAAGGLDLALVSVAVLPKLPTLPSGKVDRAACLREVRAAHETPRKPKLWRRGNRESAEDALARILGKEELATSKSFVANGGNSLNHSAAAVALARECGSLPRDWHHRPLAEFLESEGPKRRRWLISVETSVVLRALAVLTIAGNHTGAIEMLGGAHALLAIAGYNYARFILSQQNTWQRWRASLRTMSAVAIPTMLVALFGVLVTGYYLWPNVFMLDWVFGPDTAGGRHRVLWFIETYLLAMLLAAAVISIPAVTRCYRSRPWLTGVGLTLVTLIAKPIAFGFGMERAHYLPWVCVWFFMLGIAIANSTTWPKRLVTLALMAAGTYQFFFHPFHQVNREIYVAVAIALLILLANVRLPILLARVVQLLASASLYVYILQFDLFHVMTWIRLGTPWGKFIGAVVVATAIWWLVDQALKRISAAWAARQQPVLTWPPVLRRAEAS